MPLDIISESTIEDVPFYLDFDVAFEPTRVKDKKYVINRDTGDYIGVVGNSFNCATIVTSFTKETMTDNLSPEELSGATTTWKTARDNAWALMDVTLPNVTAKLYQ